MIADRFSALLAEASDDATVTGVLSWECSPPAGREAQLSRLLAETKAPLLRRLASEGGLEVNDLAALPYAVLTGPAQRWRQLLNEHPPELEERSVTLDANVEVPLIAPVGTRP